VTTSSLIALRPLHAGLDKTVKEAQPSALHKLSEGSNLGKGGDWVQVSIPAALGERVKKRLAGSDFKTMDEYVGYVLDQVLTELEGAKEGTKQSGEVFSKEDQASVEQRLRDLGYM